VQCVHIVCDHKLVAWLLALSDPVPGIIIPCINDALLWISQARLSSSLSKTIKLGVAHSPCFVNYGTAWNDCCCSEGLGSPSGSRLSLHPLASCSTGSSHTGATILCSFTLFISSKIIYSDPVGSWTFCRIRYFTLDPYLLWQKHINCDDYGTYFCLEIYHNVKESPVHLKISLTFNPVYLVQFLRCGPT
jgi:hypothetical protein